MSRDDWDRRDELRRAEMRAQDLRRDWQRQERLREDRRREALRDELRREERRREERREEARHDEERRRQRALETKAQDDNRRRGMSLLEDGFTDWGAAVLGLDPRRTRPGNEGSPGAAGGSAPHGSSGWPDAFALHDGTNAARPGLTALMAPRLLRFDDVLGGSSRLAWTAVAGATQYVLQESLGHEFVLATEIYRGDRTEHALGPWPAGDRDFRPRFAFSPKALRWTYRVKAIAGPGFLDSPWSNTA